MYCIMTRGAVLRSVWPAEDMDMALLVAVIAAAMHDYQHKGVNVSGGCIFDGCSLMPQSATLARSLCLGNRIACFLLLLLSHHKYWLWVHGCSNKRCVEIVYRSCIESLFLFEMGSFTMLAEWLPDQIEGWPSGKFLKYFTCTICPIIERFAWSSAPAMQSNLHSNAVNFMLDSAAHFLLCSLSFTAPLQQYLAHGKSSLGQCFILPSLYWICCWWDLNWKKE
jgi:hypothetical protein